NTGCDDGCDVAGMMVRCGCNTGCDDGCDVAGMMVRCGCNTGCDDGCDVAGMMVRCGCDGCVFVVKLLCCYLAVYCLSEGSMKWCDEAAMLAAM
ncbi:MAG: hypothetical protein R6X32_11075, partial [Chloroflexota bacterium]